MNDRTIERALACRLIHGYRKKNGFECVLTNGHLAQVWGQFIKLLNEPEVRAMYDDNTWRSIDVESDEPYAWYTRTLAGRFVDAWLDEHVEGNHPLTGAHLRELIGDFQDLVWNAFGDDAIQLETVPTTGHQEQDFDRHIPKVPELIDDLVDACTPAPWTLKSISKDCITKLRKLVDRLEAESPMLEDILRW